MVRRTAFRAAPAVITVRPGPATERARARGEAKAREISRPSTTARRRQPADRTSAVLPPAWSSFATFALGAVVAAVAQMAAEKGAELAVLAALVAGMRALLALSRGARRAHPEVRTGKARTRTSHVG